VVHACRAFVAQNKDNPDFLMATIDLKNAYNTFNRETMLKAVALYLPELYPLAVLEYHAPCKVYLVDGTWILSQAGQHQGESLANIKYALYDKFVTERTVGLRSMAKMLNLSFADDGYLGGATRDVAEFFRLSREAFGVHFSEYNTQKCHVHYHPDNPLKDELHSLFGADDIVLHPHFNFKILGTWIGTDEYICAELDKKVDEVIKMQEKAAEFPRTQIASLLLTNCYDECRMTYIARTTPPNIIAPILHKFDAGLKDAYQTALCHQFKDNEWDGFSFSVTSGGHGARNISVYKNAAYLASFAESKAFVSEYFDYIGAAVDLDAISHEKRLIEEFVDEYGEETVELWNAIPSQEQLSEVIDESRAALYASTLSCVADKARFMAARAKNAGVWLGALPTSDALILSNDEFRIATHFRYGWDIVSDEFRCDCTFCGGDLDKKALHATVCGNYYNEWDARHNQIRDVFVHYARKGGFVVEKEKWGLLKRGLKPADAFIYQYHRGVDYAMDVAVSSPFGKAVIREAALYDLAAADRMTRIKYNKYGKDIIYKSWKFLPLTFEATGGFGKAAECCVNTLAKRACKADNCPKAATVQQMTRKISIILARGLAGLVTRRLIPRDQSPVIGS
jgi:hypothetical protein